MWQCNFSACALLGVAACHLWCCVARPIYKLQTGVAVKCKSTSVLNGPFERNLCGQTLSRVPHLDTAIINVGFMSCGRLDSKSQLHTLVIPSVSGLKLPFAPEQDAVQLISGVWLSNSSRIWLGRSALQLSCQGTKVIMFTLKCCS